MTSTTDVKPLIPASTKLPELTFKVIIFSIVLAALLAAANAYLALKIGTTISASIPASVLAIGLLRMFKKSNVLECNIIQTAASGGEGIAAAISFILPALIILGYWKNFPYWETAGITFLGGILGVMFSIPLRRVLLRLPALRFPEGTAIGNVLKISSNGGTNLKVLASGGAAGALISLFETGFNVISSSMQMWFAPGNFLMGMGVGFSPATFAAGFIVGYEVAISLFAGVIIGWVILIPILSAVYGIQPHVSTYHSVLHLWDHKLRFVGVGLMLVGGVWTLIRLADPVIRGIRVSFETLQRGGESTYKLPRTERDIPLFWMMITVVMFALLVYTLVYHYFSSVGLPYSNNYLLFAAFITVMFVLVVGFMMATVCGYFTGLVGSSNNPLSGIMLSALLALGLLFFFLFHKNFGHHTEKVTAMIIIVATIVSAVAAISNENIQDLKAGQMVGATPWKQQFILCIGVAVSALVIGPVLELLFKAYGMGGIFPHPGMDVSQMLPAPQAGLMAAVASGLRGGQQLPWSMVLLGCGLAVVIIVIDEILRRRSRHRLPALAVGLGVYLPPEIMIPIVVGGLMNYLVRRKSSMESNQSGILLACGLVAGAALMGVFLAIPFVLMGSSSALSLVPTSFKPIANILGILMILSLCAWIYRVSVKEA